MGEIRGGSPDAAPAGHGGKARGARVPFVLRRMGAARLLPASLVCAVLASVAVTTALAGFAARALPEAAHRRLATASGTSVQVNGQIDAAQAAADTPVIRSSLRSALRTVPFTLTDGLWSDDLALPRSRGQATTPLIQAAALDGVTGHADLTAGSWPGPYRRGQPVGVALPVTTARLLGLSVAEVLVLRDTSTGAPARLRVTGLFRPRDPAAPYWQLSLLGTSGMVVQGTFVTYGPMLVNPAALGPGGLTVGAASWLAGVDTAAIAPAGLTALQHRLTAAVSFLRGAQRLGGLQVSTNLPQTLSALATSLVVSRSLLFIGSLELVLLALAAVVVAARLLVSQREEDTALLSARGGDRRQLVLSSVAEAVLLAVPAAAAGALLGGGFGAGLLLSASGLPAPGGPGRWTGAWWPAAAIALLAVIVMTWPALRSAMPGEVRVRRGRQAALSATARAGADVCLVGLGLLALWELRRYSAVPPQAGGGLGVDPVLSAAPVVALAGLALVPLRLLPAGARLLDRASAHTRHLDAALAGWQVSRRPQRHGGPILLVILAVATGTLALVQHQSWRQSQLDQASFTAGADARVELASPLALGGGGTLAHARGVLTAMPVAGYDTGFDVVALDARAAAATVLLRPDLSPLPAAALWQKIIPIRYGPGLALPGRPARLGLTAMARPAAGQRMGPLSLTLSVQDGSGITYQVPGGNLPADGRYHQLTAVLSATRQASYPLRLLGISASYTLPAKQPGRAASTVLAIRGLAVSARAAGGFAAPFAAPRALAGWQPAIAAPALAVRYAIGTPPAVTGWQAGAGAAALTFAPGWGVLVGADGQPPAPVSGQLSLTAPAPAAPLPAIATTAFLDSYGARVGTVVPLAVGGVNVPARLVAQVRGFPATGSAQPAVIVDLASLSAVLAAHSQPPLPVTQWWLRTGSAAPPALPPGATVITRAGQAAGLLADPLPDIQQASLLVIVAVVVLLTCLGCAVSVAAAVRERRLTDAVLTALGVGPGHRAGQLCLEQLVLAVPAAAAGALIGVILARWLVPAVTLTSAATAPFPQAWVVVPLPLLVVLALAVTAAPVAAAAATVRHRLDPAAQLRVMESA